MTIYSGLSIQYIKPLCLFNSFTTGCFFINKPHCYQWWICFFSNCGWSDCSAYTFIGGKNLLFREKGHLIDMAGNQTGTFSSWCLFNSNCFKQKSLIFYEWDCQEHWFNCQEIRTDSTAWLVREQNWLRSLTGRDGTVMGQGLANHGHLKVMYAEEGRKKKDSIAFITPLLFLLVW